MTRPPLATIFADGQTAGCPVLFANDAFLRLTGFDVPAAFGQPMASLLSKIVGRLIAAEIEKALESQTTRSWLADCRNVGGRVFSATIRLDTVERCDGTARQYLLTLAEANRDEPASDRSLSSMYDHAPGFIAMCEGPDHRFTYANAAYRRLVGQYDLVGQKVSDVLPILVEQGIVAILDQVYRTGAPFVASALPLHLGNGQREQLANHYLNVVNQAVRDNTGKIIGIFCEGHEVTGERTSAEKLSLLQTEIDHLSRLNAMGALAATIAHELNQPLAVISSYAAGSARLLDREGPHAGALANALREIQEAAQRGGNIIRNVRELTKRGEVKSARFALRSAIAESIRLIEAGGCFDIVISDQTPEDIIVVGDRIQVQQVIINLLRNACEATGDANNGRVSVCGTTRHHHGKNEAVVCVTDSGPGLSEAAERNIFSWTESAKVGGMGLGLSICRSIVEAHGGRIWLARDGQSDTRFCFSMPSAAAGVLQ